jgi:hypothetical protein
MSLIAAADGDRVGKFSVKGAGAEKKKLKSNGARFFGGVESRWSKNHTQKKNIDVSNVPRWRERKKSLARRLLFDSVWERN